MNGGLVEGVIILLGGQSLWRSCLDGGDMIRGRRVVYAESRNDVLCFETANDLIVLPYILSFSIEQSSPYAKEANLV